MNSNSAIYQVPAQMLEVSEGVAVLISISLLPLGFYLRLANYIMLFMTYDFEQMLESSNETTDFLTLIILLQMPHQDHLQQFQSELF